MTALAHQLQASNVKDLSHSVECHGVSEGKSAASLDYVNQTEKYYDQKPIRSKPQCCDGLLLRSLWSQRFSPTDISSALRYNSSCDNQPPAKNAQCHVGKVSDALDQRQKALTVSGRRKTTHTLDITSSTICRHSTASLGQRILRPIAMKRTELLNVSLLKQTRHATASRPTRQGTTEEKI